MTGIVVPYHLDERLADLDVPTEPHTTVTADLPETGDPWDRMARLYDRVAAAVAEADRPVVLSGDCTTSLGTVAGLQRAGVDPAIVWFDAHGDVQSPETTTSGYLGGMPLRLLVGHRPDLITGRLGLGPVPEERVVLVGARDLDPPEREYLAAAAIRRAEVADLTTGDLPEGPIYLHVDFDVVDSGDLPGLRFPAPAGPSLATVGDALRVVVDTGRVAAVGLGCTWYPGRGAADRVRSALADLLAGLDAA